MRKHEFTIEQMKQADIFKTKPYRLDDHFYKAYKRPPFFQKGKYEEEVKKLIYCYGYFVKAELGPGTILFLEGEQGIDIPCIQKAVDQLQSAILRPKAYSTSTRDFIHRYKKDKLGVDERVPYEICPDVNAHLCPVIFSYDDLPYKQIPSHRFLPCFLLPIEAKGMKYWMVHLIPQKFYEL